jgi:hypothetical protein
VSALAILLVSHTAGQTITDPAQTATAPAQTNAQTNGTDTVKDNSESAPRQQPRPQSPESLRQKAEQELKQQEQQRILGVVPNFNTTDLQNAAPLSPGQKFHLAFHSAADPFQFVAAGLDAALSQAENNFSGYGQGAQGYGKRFGAAYTDQFSGLFWGNAVFPTLFHEDPRYFRKRTGSFKSRFFYAMSTTLWTKNDNGKWGPNYANVAGNLAAGGLANLYYPSNDRGVGLTFQRAFTVTAEGTIGAVFVEFWPDIERRVFHQHWSNPPTTVPNAK